MSILQYYITVQRTIYQPRRQPIVARASDTDQRTLAHYIQADHNVYGGGRYAYDLAGRLESAGSGRQVSSASQRNREVQPGWFVTIYLTPINTDLVWIINCSLGSPAEIVVIKSNINIHFHCLKAFKGFLPKNVACKFYQISAQVHLGVICSLDAEMMLIDKKSCECQLIAYLHFLLYIGSWSLLITKWLTNGGKLERKPNSGLRQQYAKCM